MNVKADGLSSLLKSALGGLELDWFAFDMSGPETVRYAAGGLPFFTRHSDVETAPVLYDRADGVWLDSFGPTWFDRAVIDSPLAAGKRVCIVSSELHGRNPQELWPRLRSFAGEDARVILCTDRPLEALEAFPR